MSQENVDLVMRLQPPAGADLAKPFRDDATWAAAAASFALVVHPDFECARLQPGGEKTYTGIDGLRACFLESLSRWASYRADVAETIDLGGERVLVLYRDRGVLPNSTEEVDVNPAGLYTVREGKLARWENYSSHAEALKAVGLEE